MKKFVLFLSVLVSFVMASCGSTKNGVFESEGGKEDVAYLFIQSSDRDYAGKVVCVTVDGIDFEAKVVKDRKQKAKYKGVNYAIVPGKHSLKISYGGRVLLDKIVYVGSQETKVINL